MQTNTSTSANARKQAAYRQRRREDSYLLHLYLPVAIGHKLRHLAIESNRTITETVKAIVENHQEEEEIAPS